MKKIHLTIGVLLALILQACDKHIDISDKNRKTVCSEGGNCITFTFVDYHLEKDTNALGIDTISNLYNSGISYSFLLDLGFEENSALRDKYGDSYDDYLHGRMENNQTKMLLFSYEMTHNNDNPPTGETKYGTCVKPDELNEIIHLSIGSKYPVVQDNDESMMLPLNLDTLIENDVIALNSEDQKDFCIYHYEEIGRMGGDKYIEISNVLVYSADEINDALGKKSKQDLLILQK